LIPPPFEFVRGIPEDRFHAFRARQIRCPRVTGWKKNRNERAGSDADRF